MLRTSVELEIYSQELVSFFFFRRKKVIGKVLWKILLSVNTSDNLFVLSKL